MKHVVKVFQVIIVLALCYYMHSSTFIYYSDNNAQNEDTDKKMDYATLESEQYESYVESLYMPIELFQQN